MNHKPTRLMLSFMLAFSVFALACNVLTDTATPPAIVPTVFTNGQNVRPTAAVTQEAGDVDPIPTIESNGLTFGMEDIPVLPDATDILATSTSMIYTTQHTKDEASTFYMTEMEKLGWTLDTKTSLNGEAANIMRFVAGSKTVSIMVGTATGQVKVQITYLEE